MVVYLPWKDKENWKIQAVSGLPVSKSKEKCSVQAEGGSSAPKSKGKPRAQAEGALCCCTEQCSADTELYLQLITPRGFPSLAPLIKARRDTRLRLRMISSAPQSSARLTSSPRFLSFPFGRDS